MPRLSGPLSSLLRFRRSHSPSNRPDRACPSQATTGTTRARGAVETAVRARPLRRTRHRIAIAHRVARRGGGWIDFSHRSDIERDPGAPLAVFVFDDQLMLLDPFDLGKQAMAIRVVRLAREPHDDRAAALLELGIAPDE